MCLEHLSWDCDLSEISSFFLLHRGRFLCSWPHSRCHRTSLLQHHTALLTCRFTAALGRVGVMGVSEIRNMGGHPPSYIRRTWSRANQSTVLDPWNVPDQPIMLITGQNREDTILIPEIFKFLYNKGKKKVVWGGRNTKSTRRNITSRKLSDNVSYGHFRFIDY